MSFYEKGYQAGHVAGRKDGYADGRAAGYRDGYQDGMLAGLEEALDVLHGTMKGGTTEHDTGRTERYVKKVGEGQKKTGRRQG